MAVEWRRIPGTAYEASCEGHIRRADPGQGAMVGHELSESAGGGREGNYLRVVLSHEGKKKTWNVHILVAIAFHGDRREEGLVVDHVNEETHDNRPSNLRWFCPSANCARGARKRWGTRSQDLEVAGARERQPGDVF